jgi:glycosyltransferase involved in cell wall biosynthesis
MTTSTKGRPLRVLMLVDKVRAGGGAERFMTALATNLPRDRFEVTVATTRGAGGRVLEMLREGGVPHVGFHRRGRLDVAEFYRLTRFMRTQGIDVVHAHMFGSNLWGSLLGRLAGVPAVVAHEHTWSYEGEPLRKLLDGYVIGRLADTFVAVSERDRDRMIDLEGVPPEKIAVLPVPFIPRANGTHTDVRAELDIPADAPVVGTVAVLRAQKAIHVLLDAFAEVSQRMPDARLLIGGHGPLRGKLERQATELGIGERVHFLGWCEDVASLLRALDVAAMSSDFEGSPLFALECAVHGTPLVSTDVGNVAGVLGDGQGVVVVPRRDSAALADALEELLRDPARRAAQAAAAAERVKQHDLAHVTNEFADLYERLVARRRSSVGPPSRR